MFRCRAFADSLAIMQHQLTANQQVNPAASISGIMPDLKRGILPEHWSQNNENAHS